MKDEMSNLLFWQAVEDLKDEEIRGCDRHLHLCNAWNIVKRFLSSGKNVFDTFTSISIMFNSHRVQAVIFCSGFWAWVRSAE